MQRIELMQDFQKMLENQGIGKQPEEEAIEIDDKKAYVPSFFILFIFENFHSSLYKYLYC